MARNRKGQIFTTDLLISFSVVVLAILLATMMWDYTVERKAAYRAQVDTQQVCRDVAYALVDTNGYPYDWQNASNANAVGFAPYKQTLDSNRIAALARAPYNDTLRVLGVIGPGYGMRISVERYNSAGFTTVYDFGGDSNGASTIAVHQRYTLLNGSWARLTVKVWQ